MTFHRIMGRLWVMLLALIILIAVPTFAQDDAYEIPETPEDVDLTQVIAQVGDTEITVEEYRQRVRLERIRVYYFLNDLTSSRGEEILNLADPSNQVAANLQSLLAFVADDMVLGEQVYQPLVLDYIYRQEAEARGIEISECQIVQAWSSRLNLPPFGNCADIEDFTAPEGFAPARDEYLALVEAYAGVSAEEMEDVVRFDAEFAAVRDALGAEVETPDEVVVRTRHIRLDDAETADEVATRLADGESFDDLLVEYTSEGEAQLALGNRGDLGTFDRNTMVAPFSEAAFSAEVGEFVGPVETDFGFHIIEVTDQEFSEIASVRQILLESEEDAETAIGLLEDGNDIEELAQLFTINPALANGSLVTFPAGQVPGGPELEEAIFSAEDGDVIGPILSADESGYYVALVEGTTEDLNRVSARHILVETEEEAQDVLTRLEDGEDFGTLAFELSIDPSASGLGADTLGMLSRGQAQGFYALGELPLEFNPVFDAEVGDIVGPVDATTSGLGHFVFEVQEFDTRIPQNVDQLLNEAVLDWQDEQLASDTVVTTELWRGVVPFDPMPSDVFAVLAPLDEPLQQAHEAYLANREANLIPNVLRGLQLRDPSMPPFGAPSGPPGVDLNPPPGAGNDGPPIDGPPNTNNDGPPGTEDN